MKYLKVTFTLFAITLGLSCLGVNAREYTQLTQLTIPRLSGVFTSQQVDKDNDWEYTQKVKKTYSKDQISSDSRSIKAQIFGLFAGMTTTEWKTIPLNKNIDFGSGTEVQGAWKLRLKSEKSLLTTATVSVNWDLGTIAYSPYGIVGSR